MIINLRGTHGSGKSTVVKQLMGRYKAEPLIAKNEKKPQGYYMKTPFGDIRVVGSYETACGGCDAIQPYDLIWPRVANYAKVGHVIFEGALISSCLGAIYEASKQYEDFVYAYLDTPLEVCLTRIKQRRAAKGNAKPLDPKNTKSKYDGILKQIDKVREAGSRVIILDYRKPVTQLLGILRNG